jgi:Fibronectin type III domain
MATISQLPTAGTISASDLLPVSQGGSTHAISIGALLAQTQPAILIEPQSLLGRVSIGPGSPDTITIGDGLTLGNGMLSATAFDIATLPVQTGISPTDQVIVAIAGIPQLLEISQIRSLFSAGSNIEIDTNGAISASGTATYSLGELSTVTTIAAEDLVAVSQAGQDHTITYSGFLGGVTIDQVQPAEAASDSDTFFVAQTSNSMLRQTTAALWSWVSEKLPSWNRPVIELSVNTPLDRTTHNSALLICSNPIFISAQTTSLASGFSCELLNASSGLVTFSDNIITSDGSTTLSPYQCAAIYCVTYSGGTVIFASVGSGNQATTAPGQAYNITASLTGSTSITLSWSAPAFGGVVSVYTVQYRITGTMPWLSAGQTNGITNFTIDDLQASTSYDFTVTTTNNLGTGSPSSILSVATLSGSSLPGVATNVIITNITANSMSCSWTAPVVGGGTIVYGVQTRISGQSPWDFAVTNLSDTTFDIDNLNAATSYDIQVIASNSSGAGSPSSPITAQTEPVTGLVTSLSWNLIPTGSFTHGTGTIGVNVHVDPASAPVQFGFSESLTIPPTTWVEGEFINSDLWGAYIPTPTSSGSWYAWVEGTDGSAPTAYANSVTIT